MGIDCHFIIAVLDTQIIVTQTQRGMDGKNTVCFLAVRNCMQNTPFHSVYSPSNLPGFGFLYNQLDGLVRLLVFLLMQFKMYTEQKYTFQ